VRWAREIFNDDDDRVETERCEEFMRVGWMREGADGLWDAVGF
jgi:hypothetical protein